MCFCMVCLFRQKAGKACDFLIRAFPSHCVRCEACWTVALVCSRSYRMIKGLKGFNGLKCLRGCSKGLEGLKALGLKGFNG